MRARALRAPVFLSSLPPPTIHKIYPTLAAHVKDFFLSTVPQRLWGPLPPVPPLPAIFWGQKYIPVRPYALIFSVFLFFSFWIFLSLFSSFSSLLFNFFLFFSSYLFLFISEGYTSSSYSSPLIFSTVCRITYMHINYICTHIRYSEGFLEGAKLFLSSYSSILYYILPLLILLFL